jgi:hypothetical protein
MSATHNSLGRSAMKLRTTLHLVPTRSDVIHTCGDGFGLVLPLEWRSLSVQVAAICGMSVNEYAATAIWCAFVVEREVRSVKFGSHCNLRVLLGI